MFAGAHNTIWNSLQLFHCLTYSAENLYIYCLFLFLQGKMCVFRKWSTSEKIYTPYHTQLPLDSKFFQAWLTLNLTS